MTSKNELPSNGGTVTRPSPEILHEAGNSLLKQGNASRASSMFLHAMDLVNTQNDGLPCALLQNSAAAYLHLHRPDEALIRAAAAMTISKVPPERACHRAAQAMVMIATDSGLKRKNGKPVRPWRPAQSPEERDIAQDLHATSMHGRSHISKQVLPLSHDA
eukprot:jgi/Ulvmu1/11194/UM072_0030.1